ncbi:uncharacterized protein LOC113005019 [Solenopsis invicta]|uniref:uncharacterized protein LOC113005019 n=1 Tax=Solenopsis invicta TaxID=13686 RepID=UPI000E33E263|nr:uncharacterized protein LOC113005019 [Solenopsis invicta]
MALRVISAYRTVSHETAAIMAGQIPIEIMADERARLYHRMCALREQDVPITRRLRTGIGNLKRSASIDTWKERLEEEGDYLPGARVREHLIPILKDWINRDRNSGLFFRTQIITGHGCFNVYLYKIGRAMSPICAHCNKDFDTANHTLLSCTEWNTQRETLEETFNRNFTLGTIFAASLENPAKWRTFTDFCEGVMSIKEEAERVRQRMTGIQPRCRRPARARIRPAP